MRAGYVESALPETATMDGVHDHLIDELRPFVAAQHVFFVATAPRDGRVNVSPKGGRRLRVIDAKTVAWLDVTGSGNETAAHVTENGRMTLMLCAFEGEPLILRLQGHARIVRPRDAEWEAWAAHFEPVAGTRQIFVLTLERVATACGFGVPLYARVGDRTALEDWAAAHTPEQLQDYRDEHNSVSIDGLDTGHAQFD
jgi:hypothetical protein